MFRALTQGQRSLIMEYLRLTNGQVYFHGLDQNDSPVISFVDANGHHAPFAVGRRSNRPTTDPAYPLRWFTDEEIVGVDPSDHELLTQLARPPLEGSNGGQFDALERSRED